MSATYSLSILVPTLNEVTSLRETVEVLMAEGGLSSDILEIILVIGDQTLDKTNSTCQELECQYAPRVHRVTQQLPLLGGAFRSGIAKARGTHIVTMFADLESDPHLVPTLVSESKSFPESIISASRWLKGGGFTGYGFSMLVLNYMFQRICGFGCKANLSDYTYGFRVYPSHVLKEIRWRETDHAFVIESILRPHFRGVPIREVAAIWSVRKEGPRRIRFRQYLKYLPTICRVLREHRTSRSPSSALERRKTTETSSVVSDRLSSTSPGKTGSLPISR